MRALNGEDEEGVGRTSRGAHQAETVIRKNGEKPSPTRTRETSISKRIGNYQSYP
jgi:hypothetical protein